MSAATPSSSSNVDAPPNEEQLRKALRQALQSLNRREPLDPNYRRLISNGIVTSRRPVLPKDKFYRRVGSRLRERVEAFMAMTEGKDPFDRISQRQPLEENAMRAALTLREAKEHEQLPLLEATLASLPHRNGMDEAARRRHFEGIALTLQSEKKKTTYPTAATIKSPTAAEQIELERQRAQARAREVARHRRREEEDRKKREEELQRKRQRAETPQQQLQKVYQPIFKKLWDMEFANLNNTNPFRIVIDRGNCEAMGAPDYFDVITTPMNLTYIQQKVEKAQYESLQDFFKDVDLMISNALLYNSDPSNPFRIAAEEMKKRYMKIAKKVVQTLKEKKG